MNSTQENLSKISSELTAYLRLTLRENISIAGELVRLEGGFDTDTFAFVIENAPTGFPAKLVLRLFRNSGESDRVIIESTIQNAAHAAGHPVPAVPLDSSGHLLTRRPFIVMERLRGTALANQLDDRAVFEKLPALMANLQIGLHRINPANLRNRLAESGAEVEHMTPGTMLARISEMADSSGAGDLVSINRWLVDHWPTQPANPVICHGDFHPNNILVADGEVTGLIDWGNVMFTHPEYDVAITHLIMSVGPLEETPIPPEELQSMIDWAMSEYLAAYRSHRPIDENLFKYYGALRTAHAYSKIIAAKHGVGLPYAAHDAYAWKHPALFAAIRRVLERSTGVTLEPA